MAGSSRLHLKVYNLLEELFATRSNNGTDSGSLVTLVPKGETFPPYDHPSTDDLEADGPWPFWFLLLLIQQAEKGASGMSRLIRPNY